MKKILVFQHIPREHPSNIANYADDRGIGLDIVELWNQTALPSISGYDALIILGGSMGVYDEYPNKAAELVAISEAVGAMPILGICLGAQLLAHALGANVYPHRVGGTHIKEVGYYDVTLTPDAAQSTLFAGFPQEFKVLEWHGDTFDLPKDAALLAEAPLCKNQAFSYGNAYGVQFHVEATPEIVEDWLTEDTVWTHTDFDIDDERVRRTAYELAPLMREQCYRLMDNFLA